MQYENFAYVYDLFMDVDYEAWTNYIEQTWKRHGAEPNLVCELGCGTGNITTRLSQKGYEMIGVDFSQDMLSVAMQKQTNGILYLNQDMRQFELYGTVDSIISICDSLNYILTEDDLLAVFRLVHNYLNPDGLFLFDMNTLFKFQNTLANNDFCQTSDDICYIWENFFNEKTYINEYFLNFFMQNENGQYDRFEEHHRQKAYSPEVVSTLLAKADMRLLSTYDAFTFEPPTPTSERIFFVAKKL